MHKKLIALIAGLIIVSGIATTVTAESIFNNDYRRAEKVRTAVTFDFGKQGSDTAEFDVVNIDDGMFLKTRNTEIELIKVVGRDTESVHNARDAYVLSGSSSDDNDYSGFNLDISIVDPDGTVEDHQFSECDMSSYQIETKYDKEEGWVDSRKGFATVEIYKIRCSTYNP